MGGTLRVESFLTFLRVAMLAIGGQRSLTGAIFGTIVIAAVSETLRRIEVLLTVPGGFSFAGLGDVTRTALTPLILCVSPRGLTAGKEMTALSRVGEPDPPPLSALPTLPDVQPRNKEIPPDALHRFVL